MRMRRSVTVQLHQTLAREVFTDARLSSKQREPARYRPRAPIGPRCSSGRVGLQNRPGGCESLRTCHLFSECSVDSLHDSLKTRRCWCDSSRSHHSRKRRVRRRSHKPTLPVQLGILLPFFSERSLEVRHSAWDRDHACAGAQQRDRAAAGGARRAESDEHEPIPPLFVALPAARAPALLTPRAARGYAISALRATSDHFHFSGVWLSQRSTGP
jgi:hypothetical protein